MWRLKLLYVLQQILRGTQCGVVWIFLGRFHEIFAIHHPHKAHSFGNWIAVLCFASRPPSVIYFAKKSISKSFDGRRRCQNFQFGLCVPKSAAKTFDHQQKMCTKLLNLCTECVYMCILNQTLSCRKRMSPLILMSFLYLRMQQIENVVV